MLSYTAFVFALATTVFTTAPSPGAYASRQIEAYANAQQQEYTNIGSVNPECDDEYSAIKAKNKAVLHTNDGGSIYSSDSSNLASASKGEYNSQLAKQKATQPSHNTKQSKAAQTKNTLDFDNTQAMFSLRDTRKQPSNPSNASPSRSAYTSPKAPKTKCTPPNLASNPGQENNYHQNTQADYDNASGFNYHLLSSFNPVIPRSQYAKSYNAKGLRYSPQFPTSQAKRIESPTYQSY
ncbi:hypothetical protein DSO57_1036960 [Entomophthora muscae]|uniref:Uncharacterized protein n=1 Tax=Entomophthora muscae TaxID=34485 RepID=A0ACC2TLW0_9FUNG|nr:hypothetical protein DSO57_1036960 [Entomophthora muscae]